MPSTIVSYLLVIPMLMHGLFGCCWHHVHSAQCRVADSQAGCRHDNHDEAESVLCENLVEAKGECHGHSHGDAKLALTGHSVPIRHTPQECPGSRCHFVGSSRVRDIDPAAADLDGVPLALPEIRRSCGCVSLVIAPFRHPASATGPGQLRTHALYCVWLI